MAKPISKAELKRRLSDSKEAVRILAIETRTLRANLKHALERIKEYEETQRLEGSLSDSRRMANLELLHRNNALESTVQQARLFFKTLRIRVPCGSRKMKRRKAA